MWQMYFFTITIQQKEIFKSSQQKPEVIATPELLSDEIPWI